MVPVLLLNSPSSGTIICSTGISSLHGSHAAIPNACDASNARAKAGTRGNSNSYSRFVYKLFPVGGKVGDGN